MKRRSITLLSIAVISGILFSIVCLQLGGAIDSNGGPVSQYSENLLPQAAADESDLFKITSLERTYTIDQFGLTRINDKMVIKNLQSSSQLSFKVCLTDQQLDDAIFYSASDINNIPLSINLLSSRLSGFNVLQITLDQPLYSQKSYTVNLNYTLKDHFSYHIQSASFNTLIYKVPVVPYEISEYISKIILPSTASSSSLTNDSTQETFESSTALPAYSEVPLSVQFVNSQSDFVKINSLNREIIINPLGFIRVEEEITLESFTHKQIGSLRFEVPGDAMNASAYDDLGDIKGLTLSAEKNERGMKTLTFSLSNNRARLSLGTVFYFNLVYFIPYDAYVSNDLSISNLQVNMFLTRSNFLIEEQLIRIRILGGTKIDRVGGSYVPDRIYNLAGATIIQSSFTDITSDFYQEIDVDFNYSGLSLYKRAFLYSLILFSLLSLYVFFRIKKPRDDLDEAYTTVPIQEIRQFVTLYEEKNALIVEKEKGDEDLINRKIKKKNYTKMVKAIEKKINELNEEIMPFKNALLEESGKWSEIVKRLDYLEAEKTSIFDSLRLLEQRYKKGKLPSKAAYDRLSMDLIKKIDKSQNKIDRNINELRAFII